MAEWPPSLKPITKFMARAREVEKSEPVVSYYCNFYSLSRAMQLRDTSDDSANLFVKGLLEKCEVQKESIGPDDGSHRAKVEEFALSVFDRADTEDRADKATKATAVTFYAAACFLEVCSIFGKLSGDIEERLRYAKWKAADITKALREGRKPIPGAPGEAEARAKAEAEAAERERAEAEAREKSEPEHDVTTIDVIPSQDPAPNGSSSSVPPAPPIHEYETEANEDTGPPNGVGEAQYPNVDNHYPMAPKYPSSDAPSPLQPKASTPAYPTLDISAPPRGIAPPSLDINAPLKQVAPPAPTLDISAPIRPPAPSLDINAPPRPPVPSLDISAPPRPAIPSLDIHAAPRQIAPSLDIDAPPRQSGPSPPSLFLPGQTSNGSLNEATPSSQFKAKPPKMDLPKMDLPSVQMRPALMGAIVPAPAPAPAAVEAAPVAAAALPAPPVVQTAAPIVKKADPNYKPSIKQTQEAQRLAKYAASALDFQDLRTAVANLEDALGLLTGQKGE